jgi:hypothetical protein
VAAEATDIRDVRKYDQCPSGDVIQVTKLAKRTCRNCGRSFPPATFHQAYCQVLCRQAAARVRDREAKRGIRAPRDPFLETKVSNLRHAIGKCGQCGSRKELRFDDFGSTADDMLIADPVFCSQDCAASWWLGRADPPNPDQACEQLRKLVFARKPR